MIWPFKKRKRHTFLFLTKRPYALRKWSPFPGNCWIGATATDKAYLYGAATSLSHVEAPVKFLSIEPLLAWQSPDFQTDVEGWLRYGGISWLIIGQQTPISKKAAPKVEWIREIVDAGDCAGIPIFLKNNLKPLLRNEEGWTPAWAVSARDSSGVEYLRQEIPTGV